MTFFLRARHWQIFLLMLFAPFFVELVCFLITEFTSGSPFGIFTATLLKNITFLFFYFGWIYSAGIYLNSILPSKLKLNTAYFKLCLSLLAITMTIMYVYSEMYLEKTASGSFSNSDWPLFLLAPVYLFCAVYSYYFVVKALKTVEQQRPSTFGECFGDFFLIIFFPIGIWFIQPRINKLFLSN